MSFIGYARVSSVGQSLDIQLDKLQHCEKIFQEKHSAVSGKRPRLDACLEYVREYWARLGEHFDTTTEALRRQISQVPGLLDERGKGRNIQVSKWIAGKTRRALALNKAAVQRIYGLSLQNEPTVPRPEMEAADAEA